MNGDIPAQARAREDAAYVSPSDPLAELGERVDKGIAWLTEHDPHGAFHFWFTAGLLPTSPMPSQPPEVVEEWKRYHANRSAWEVLFRRLQRLEKEREQRQATTS